MKYLPIILILVTCLLVPRWTMGQEDTDTTIIYSVITSDGNKYLGSIVSQDDKAISLSTDMGTIVIQRLNIREMHEIKTDQMVNGKYWYPNLQSSRYFFAPNGYGLRKGEAYYQNVWVLLNQINVGIIDYFSIGFGLVPSFLFGTSQVPVWVTPKVSVPIVKEKLNVGAGLLFGTVPGAENTNFGIGYGVATYGSRDRNITLGMGYIYSDDEWAKKPLFTISGYVRLSPRSYLMSENYIIYSVNDSYSEQNGKSTVTNLVLSIGGRSIINRVSIDYGLFIPAFKDQNVFIAIPWLGITIPLHKKTRDPK